VSEKFENYGNDIKRIVFNVSDHDHAKLILRLKHNSLTQAEFFRAIIMAVNENDENILNFIDSHTNKKQKQSKEKIKKSNLLIDKGNKIIKDFSFADEELDDIFDLIATEHPNL
jgi:hypothetical protein|tara:strand:+ start:431 stop:772 length:342 start_codon:yes stop_codon:yes gene_type:complete